MSRFDSAIDQLTTDPVRRQSVGYRFNSTSPPPNEIPSLAIFANDIANLSRGYVSGDLVDRVSDAGPLAFSNGPTGKLIQWFAGQRFESDPSFRVTDEQIKQITENVPQDLWHRYGDAVSQQHLDAIYSRNTIEADNRRRLQDAGWVGTASQVLAEAFDPASLAVAVLTGGAGTVGSAATTSARLLRLTRAGLVAGAPFAAMKAAQATYDDSVSRYDVLEAGLSGFGFGVGSAATEGAGVLLHAASAGLGAGVPILGVDALRSDRDSRDALFGFTTAFLTGAIGSGLSRWARGRLEPVFMEQQNRAFLADAQEFVDNLNPTERSQLLDGGGSSSILTAKGKDFFAAELDPQRAAAKLNEQADVLFDAGSNSPSVSRPFEFSTDNFTVSPVGDRIGTMSRRQFKQEEPTGFRAVPGEKQLVARLGSDGYVEIGDAFFAKSKAERLAAVEDAVNGGRDIPGDLWIIQAAKKRANEVGYISASDIEATFTIRNADGTTSPRFTRDQAETIADRLTAMALFEQRRQGLNPSGSYRASSPSGTPESELLSRAYALSRELGSVSASKIANRLKIPYEDAKALADQVRAVGTPFILETRSPSAAVAPKVAPPPADPIAPATPVVAPAMQGGQLTPSALAAVTATPDRAAMGAASAAEFKYLGNRIPGQGKFVTDFEASWIDDSKPTFGNVRVGVNSSLSNSELASVRRFGNIAAYDNLFKKNGRIYVAGDLWAESGSRDRTHQLLDSIKQLHDDYKASGGTLSREAFDDAVGRAVVSNDQTLPKQIREAADTWRKTAAEMLELSQRHNVPQSRSVSKNPNYIPHRWLDDVILVMGRKYGEQKVLSLLAEAIQKHPDNFWMESSQIMMAAKAIYKNGGQPGRHSSTIGFLEGTKNEIVLDLMSAGVPEADAVRFVDSMRFAYKTADANGTPLNFLHRIAIDENHSIPVGNGESLSVLDLLDTNISRIGKSYIRRTFGNSAAAEMYRVMSPDPAKPFTSMEQIYNMVRQEAAERGIDRIKTEKQIETMEVAYRNMVGLPISDDIGNSRFWKAAAILRSGLSASMLGNWYAGLTNAIEPIAALARPDAMARVFPVLPELWAMCKDGKPSNAFLRDFVMLTGRGVEWSQGGVPTRVPIAGSKLDIALAKGERMSQKARRATAALSLMAPANDAGYRTIGYNIMHQWAEWAQSGKLPPKAVMKEFGFANDEQLLRRVYDQINKHKIANKDNPANVKMWDLNLSRWDDMEAYTALRAAVNTEASTRFVNALPNQNMKWMSSEWGKLFGQFKFFSSASYDQKLLQGIASGNPDHIRMFMVQAGFASALYAAKVYVDSLGRPDAQEYRDQMLAPDRIARVAFSRGSYATLMPAAIDAASTTFGGPAVFSFSRGSGIQGGGLMSVPVLDWASGAASTFGSVVRRPFDSEQQFSMKDLRNLRRSILFLPSIEPLVKGIDALGRAYGLPEESNSTGGVLQAR